MSFLNYLKLLVRRRTKDSLESETAFHRCLKALDVTLLGLGSMLGAGLYIATGEIARRTAGPAIVLSLLIAAVPVCLCSLCFAEFGSRISRTGSSYSYTYFAMGEVWAFLVGWNLILENTIAVALLGHETSRFINNIAGGHIYKFFLEHVGNWKIDGFLHFPDFLAFAVIFIFMIVSAVGVRRTASFIRVATLINVLVILFVILAGIYYVDTKNWNTMHKFAPYGFHGVMLGAANSYFAYLGFDTLNTASEETLNPKTTIPYANMISTYAGVAVYLVIAAILTLMIPYTELTPQIALPEAFSYQGFPLGKYFVAVGGVFALTTSLVTYLFSGSRIMYAMAHDGLLFEFLGKVHSKSQAPVRAVFVCGITAATVALFVDTNKLVEMLSIGTMLAYTMVATSVILDRYKPEEIDADDEFSIKVPNLQSTFGKIYTDGDPPGDESKTKRDGANLTYCDQMRAFWRLRVSNRYSTMPDHDLDNNEPDKPPLKPSPDPTTHRIACVACASMIVSSFGFFLAVMRSYIFTYVMTGVFGALALASIVVLYLQPMRDPHTKFSVPFVPAIPIVSIVFNEYLLTNLSTITWASFTVWTFIGFVVYFIFGFRNSKEGKADDEMREFLMKCSPPLSKSTDDFSPMSSNSSTSSDIGLLSSIILTSDEERSPSKKRSKHFGSPSKLAVPKT